MTQAPIRLDIFSDPVCPWCYAGKANLDRALAQHPDHPFQIQQWEQCCAICGSGDSYLDELIVDDAGSKQFVCSDTDYCAQRAQQQESRP